jgi:hypothetical protein
VSVAKRDSFALLFIVYCFFLRQKSQSLAASLCLRFRASTPGRFSGLPAPLQIEQLCRRLHCLRPLLVLLIVLLQCVRCNNLFNPQPSLRESGTRRCSRALRSRLLSIAAPRRKSWLDDHTAGFFSRRFLSTVLVWHCQLTSLALYPEIPSGRVLLLFGRIPTLPLHETISLISIPWKPPISLLR